MILTLAVLAIQILCVVDVIRNRANQLWIMALIFLPIASTIAYVIVEVLPRMQGNRHVRTTRAQIVARLDPQREVRDARAALDLADTVANRLRLADALVALERWDEALPLYHEARSRGADDRHTADKTARAEFETGDAAAALASLDAAPAATTLSDRDRTLLLRARILDHLGRREESLATFADLVMRYPGEEARCRYAAVLIEAERRDEALAVLEEVERRMRLLDRQQRAAEAEMYRWAMQRLTELRASR